MGGGIGRIHSIYGTGKLLVTNNTARSGGGIAEIFYVGGDSATLIISDNKAKYGGGMANIYAVVGIGGNRNLQIFNNTATVAGGGAYFNGDDFTTGGGSLTNANIYNNKVPLYNGVFAEQNVDLNLVKCRLFNPDASGAHNAYEVYGGDRVSIYSEGSWFGESDTSGLIGYDASSALDLHSWVQCDWTVNDGLPVVSIFPVKAKFRLNTGAPLAAGSFPGLQGRFSGTLGTFTPPLATIVPANEIVSSYKATGTGAASILAIVDADTFRKDLSVTVGIREAGFEAVKVYPNPGLDVLSISGLAAGSDILLYDLSGRHIAAPASNAGAVSTIDVSGIAHGNYILTVRTASGTEGSVHIRIGQ